ncbi:PEP/pyruvate-binding domain-containing protein [Arthrobacter sp. ISL-30]|uniref:PEP/pyruvate-binding domain-containing protein n=1 Tax=Arthrobacter sp. ISL-30 TaxID=2819109 RepID=UPI0035B36EE7
MEQSQSADGRGPALVLPLHGIGSGMLQQVGGKAANLGELLSGGFPVPEGFCLTTEAYRSAIRPEQLSPVIEALADTDPADLAAIAELAGRARSLVFDAGLPPAVEDALRHAYLKLSGKAAPNGGAAVAVRSSATAEDLPSASFAGQQDTYLNVIGLEPLRLAVLKCWASLWTDRAVNYRTSNGINHATVALAVVVQEMVDAKAAGVLFTANPVTGSRHQAVIDASPGLGEAVVSGAVNPDHFVVDSVAGSILARKLGDKRLVIRPLHGGGTERIESGQPGVESATPCLEEGQVTALADLGRLVEAHFGAPQDIEWAIDHDGKPWLTQARPITTLYPLPQRAVPAEGDRVYLCFSLAQGLTRPITPMGLAGIRLIGSSVARAAGFDVPDPRKGPPPYAEAGQRVYFDLTAVLRSATGRAIVPRVFDIMEARSATIMRRLFDDPRFAITSRTPLRLIRHVGPVLVRYRAPETLLRGAFRPTAALARLEQFGSRLERSLEVPDGATPRERLDHAERILGRELFSILPNTLPLAILGFGALGLVHKLLGQDAPFSELQPVLRGLPNNVTTEMDLELWDLAADIRADKASVELSSALPPTELAAQFKEGSLPEVAQSGLEHFLTEFGHRAVAEIDLGMPRWSDDPTHIIGILVNYLRLDEAGESLVPDRQFRKAQAEAEAQIAKLVALAGERGGRVGRVRSTIVSAALDRTRRFAGLRELPKYNIVLGLAAARRQISLVGEELAASGRIAEASDIYFLDLEEARQGLDGTGLHALVEERRSAYELELKRRHIPRLLFSDGTEPEALSSGTSGLTSDGALTGTPASAGSVSAVARVILDPVGAHLEPGEILVAPSTDPGWTPLFLTAGGLVMEMGGANSHGAVVAREYGIPAVVGVADATSLLRTGQRITVDGGAGSVTFDP